MYAVLQSLYSGLPILIIHFVTTILIFAFAVSLYMRITPNHEWSLIKEGNMAASISICGALMGLAIPMSFCLSSSINVYDIVIWGLVILFIQLVTYYILDFVLKGISERIKKGEVAPVLLVATIKVCIGIMIAAAISG